MKTKILAVLLFVSAAVYVPAQTNSKFDLRLTRRLIEGKISNTNMPLLVKGDEARIKKLTEHLGGKFKYSYNNISSVEIPEKNLLAFSQSKYVLKIEATGSKGVFLMDTARIRNNIDSVQYGYAPLPHDMKGRNVIVGIVDGGIYWQHLDFRKPADSTTRIRYIWDQVVNGANIPLPYNYGNEWSWLDIDNGNCTHVPPANDFGHGTCVAGIAAGNSLSTKGTVHQNELTGVAPESEIIAVRLNNSDNNFLTHVADACDYIFKKADALGKPCVINTSVGTYYGSHDGIDLTTQTIEAMLEQRNGRVLVAAAGNAGNIYHHLGYNVPSDSAYTFFKYNTSANEIYFDLWADTANFKNAYFSVGCNDTLGNDFGRLNYLNVVADFNPPQGAGVTLSKNLFRNSNLLGQVNMQATLDEGRYHVEFLITPSDASNYWRLQTSVSGKFDLWSSSTLIGSADMTDYIQTGDTSNPQIYIQYPNYRHPDSLKTMVSSWQNSDKVITVANYSNRAGYFDRDSNYQDMTAAPYSEVIGKRFATSSIGPTRDGRMKPDVSATGSTTICTGDANFIAVATAPQNRIKVYVTKKHIRNGGTSMSSPIVAGIAALYLEKRPTATYNEIKQALICTATKDNFTGNTPNFEYGYGKVNAFRALTVNSSCFVYGTNDTACLNYNPLATVDTGGCVAKVYGCTDTLAANYNPLANVSNGNCVYTSVKSIGDNVAVKVLPNPFSGQTVFKIEGLNFEHAEIKIYNQLGELANVLELAPGKAEYLYRSGTNARGIYHYLLFADGKFTKAGKLVIE